MTAFYIPNAPLEDEELDNALQALVVGITGMSQTMVRPRWQPKLPKQPEPNIDWCSIGVITSMTDDYPSITHLFGDDITAPAGDLLQEHEEFDAVVSFYGPHAKKNLGVLRSGLKILQNLESIRAAGIHFVGIEPARVAPDLLNQQWVRRWDTVLVFRRMVARAYGIPNILTAEIDLFDDTGHVDRVIKVPPTP